MFKELEMPKYPYLGYSSNLIEYFLIIGYEKEFIKEELIPNFFSDHKQVFEPTILNSICSSSDVEMLDNDILIKLCYPKPQMIISSTNMVLELAPSSVVFFLNGDTVSSKSKSPFHGYSFLFYESMIINAMKILIPKAFCLISQYPFFTFFHNLCKTIFTFFKSKSNEIPMEILLYNIINFTPSPINESLNLNLFPLRDLSSYGCVNLSSSFSSQCSTQYNSSPRASQLISQLSGYPMIDFNLSVIFNILPVTTFIEILVFNILEFDMLFFSKNLEILNMVMYITATLNYPCNDSIYLWHILSVSIDDLLYPDDSTKFVGKPCSSMLGVNSAYDSKIEEIGGFEPRIIVDLDNKLCFYQYMSVSPDVSKAISLQNYIRKILKEKTVQSAFLEKIIQGLVHELDEIMKQEHVGYSNNSSQVMPMINFFETGDKITKVNRRIQEAFYDFILNILTVFYNNYSLNSTFDKKKPEEVEQAKKKSFFIHYSEDLRNFAEEEVIFCEFFKYSNKYNNYVLNFIQEFKCIQLYKVPLAFSEEFIYIKKGLNIYGKTNSSFFDIMESFYSEKPSLVTRDSNSGSYYGKHITVNFHSFFSYYELKWRGYFYREISKSHVIQCRQTSAFKKTKYFFDYEFIELDSEVLFKYIYLLNNLSQEKKEEIFPSIGNQKSIEIKSILSCEVVDTIERSLISQKIIRYDNLILYSLLMIFAVTRNLCNFSESISQLSQIIEMLENRTFFVRKYINIVLNVYNHEISGAKNTDDSRFHKNIGIMCNFIIINFLRNKNILPNEQMMLLFERFLFNNLREKDDMNTNPFDDDDQGPDLENYKLFFKYNYCRDGTKKPEYFLRLAENNDYDGSLCLECDKCNLKETRTVLVFQFDFMEKTITSELFSPVKLYRICQKMCQMYMETLDYSSIDRSMFKYVLVNLLFYSKQLNMSYKFLLKFLLNELNAN